MKTIHKRRTPFVYSVQNTLLALLLAFGIGALILLAIGSNPLETYFLMFKEALFEKDGFARTLHVAAPLILTGLAITVTFRANIFNMGVEGQMLLGGFFSGIAAANLQGLPSLILIPFCLAIGIFCGILFALIPALLKAYCNTDEMVVTLMLNYVVIEVLTFLSEGVFRDPSAGYVATRTISPNAMFSKLFGSDLTFFTLIALAVFLFLLFLFKRSLLGIELTAIGKNVEFAEAVGMNYRKKLIIFMVLSGALSGLAGAGWMLSEKFRYTLSFSGSPGLGWDGMLISLLGAHSPVGVFIAALFYSSLKVGMSKIELFTSIPAEIISIIQSLMILFLSIHVFTHKRYLERKLIKEAKSNESLK